MGQDPIVSIAQLTQNNKAVLAQKVIKFQIWDKKSSNRWVQTDGAQRSKEDIDRHALFIEWTRSANISNSKFSCKAFDSLEKDSNS